MHVALTYTSSNCILPAHGYTAKVTRLFSKESGACETRGGGGGMTVEVRTCFAVSLLILSISMPLIIGTLKMYVTDICRMDLKILSSQLKLLLLIFIQE